MFVFEVVSTLILNSISSSDMSEAGPADTPANRSNRYVEKEDEDDSNTFKILISTDNHLGYNEECPIRCNDSFNTFEEVLQLAQKEQV